MDTATPDGAASHEPWRAWAVLVLLFFFQFINYADKTVLGLAGAGIRQELHLSYAQFGDVGSSFFLLFAVSSVIFGFTANHFPSRWLILGMGLVWAATQFPMVGTVGVGTLITCRILLGASEGPGAPVAVHATYKWFEDSRRTLPTALLVLGAGVGSAVSGQVLPHIIEAWNWHAAFLTVGLIGVVWSVAWFLIGREGPLVDKPITADLGGRSVGVPYRDLLLNRTILGLFLVTFASYWTVAVGLVWGFMYLVDAAGLTQVESGQVVTLPTVISIFLAPALALLSQRLVRRGVPTRYSRGAFGCLGAVLGGLGFAGMAVLDGAFAKVACYTFAASFAYFMFTVAPPIIAEITPTRQRAAMLSIYNAFYSLAGILAPSVMGRVLQAAPDPLTGYRNGYLLMALFLAVAGVVGFLLINPARDAARLASKLGRRTAAVPGYLPAE
jgi:MFS family permease